MSDTPRTDSQLLTVKDCSYVAPHPSGEYVHADFARLLERENAALREENAEWREMIREAVFDNNDILYWIRGARSILLDAVEKDRAAYAARKEAQS